MPVLQQYYTSYHDEVTGSSGYQVKASSPGITPQLQTRINGLILYRLPPSLHPQGIDAHPIALRYLYDSPQQCIFICSQSIGNDDYGRPGNFFAHTVVMEPALFALGDPILYWHSPFWQRSDPEVRANKDSLPVLNEFSVMPSYDAEGMWTFLEQDNRREWLYKLLCAVIHYPKTQRRIVILDTIENTALWIAIVTLLLPPLYRLLLSFATYYHDLQGSPYLITGTTSDWFKDVESNYLTSFVLNATQGRSSKIEDSLYARRVMEVAYSDRVESELQPLLTDYTRRFPVPTAIDQQLELMMLYTDIQKGRNEDKLSMGELQAIHLALNSFEQLHSFEPEDVIELQRLYTVLGQALNYQPSGEVLNEYQRVDALLKRQAVQEVVWREEQRRLQPRQPLPMEQIPAQIQSNNVSVQIQQNVVQNDVPVYGVQGQYQQNQIQNDAASIVPVVQDDIQAILEREAAINEEYFQKPQESPQIDDREHVQNEIQSFISSFHSAETVKATAQRFQQLRQQINDAQLAEYINQPFVIQWIIDACKDESVSFPLLCSFWQYFGSYLQPGSVSLPIMIFSLNQVSKLSEIGRGKDSAVLFKALFSMIQEHDRDWLPLIVAGNDQLPPGLAVDIYCECVGTLTELDQRVPYRIIILPLFEDLTGLLKRELRDDIHYVEEHGGPQQVLDEIENWARHIRRQNYEVEVVEELIDVGLRTLKEIWSTQQWRELAHRILSSADLTPLADDIEYQLVRIVLPAMSLPTFKPEDVALCKKYCDYSELSEDTRTTLATILAMQDGKMDEKLAQRIQRQVKILLPYEYSKGIVRFMDQFLRHDITSDAHKNMVSAFFTRQFNYDNSFWQAYMDTWQQIFLQSTSTHKAVDLLAFWFDLLPAQFPQSIYVVQEFFMRLSSTLEILPQKEGYKTAVPEFHKSDTQNWYSIVQEYFPEKAGMGENIRQTASSIFGKIGVQFKYPQNLSHDAGKQKDDKMAKFVTLLFERGSEKKHHRQYLNNYPVKDYKEFWIYYERHLITLLLRDAFQLLDLLSFWFDESFELLDKTNYLSQAFFLRLHSMLDAARNQQGFSAIAQIIETAVAKEPEKYPWYPLIRNYFTLPASGKSNGA